jgi:hypothetical protein
LNFPKQTRRIPFAAALFQLSLSFARPSFFKPFIPTEQEKTNAPRVGKERSFKICRAKFGDGAPSSRVD